MKKTVMRKYAQLAVRRGAHVKKGQGCVIYAQVEQHEFAQLVAEEAYRAGAKWVEMRWEDQVCTKLKYRHETLTQLSQVAEWEKARMQHYVDTLPAMIHISSADPDGLKGVNVEKMQKSGAARGMALKSYHDALDNKYQWCIIAVPSKKWAKKVFPGERVSVAVEKLWAIYQRENEERQEAEWHRWAEAQMGESPPICEEEKEMEDELCSAWEAWTRACLNWYDTWEETEQAAGEQEQERDRDSVR